MKNVAICSLMRAGSEYEQAYYLQILGLSRRTFTIQSVNIVYDAEPKASEWLRELLRSRGIPVHYEIESLPGGNFERLADRVGHWAASANQCLELALSHGEGLSHLAWIEADLSYPYDTMEVLLERDKPIIAPCVYLNNVFYDSWGFRTKNGTKITSIQPVHAKSAHELIELNSVGSYVLFDIAVFRSNIRFRADYEHGLLVGVCEDAAKIGFATFADAAISILHPVTAWREQLWSCTRIKVFVNGVLESDQPTPGAVFGGAYEEMIRPWLNQSLGPTYDSMGERRISITCDPSEKTFEVKVDFESKPSDRG
jgi:hypothetical protein